MGGTLKIPQQWRPWTMVAAAGCLFAGIALAPLLWPFFGLLDTAGPAAASGIEASQWALLLRSLGLSLAVVIGALLLGIPAGLLLARGDIIGRQALWAIQVLPLFLPPFLLALGWFYLFGRRGVLGNDLSANLLFGPVGHIAVLSLIFSPVVVVSISLSLWRLPSSLEMAARTVASTRRVLLGILLPAVGPAIGLGALVVFVLAFSELGVPMFFGVDVYPAVVFSMLGGVDYDPARASMLALPLFPLIVFLALLERRLGKGWVFASQTTPLAECAPLHLGAWRTGLSLLLWLWVLASLLPIAGLLSKALAGGASGQGVQAWLGDSLANSMTGAAVAATIIVVIGTLVGYGVARRIPGARLFEGVGLLAFVAPTALLAVGLIALWNRPLTQWVYAGPGIIILGYVARYGIIGVRSLAMAVSQSPVSLEQAAASSGAGFFRSFFCIVLPLQARVMAASWLLAFVFCLRDLESAVLYYPPGREPLTVRIFTLEANGPEPLIASLALIQVMLTACIWVALFWLFQQSHRRRY